MPDFIDSIVQNPILTGIIININNYLHNFLKEQIFVIGLMLLISFGIAYFLSTKLLTKTAIIITLGILIYFVIRYIGIK